MGFGAKEDCLSDKLNDHHNNIEVTDNDIVYLKREINTNNRQMFANGKPFPISTSPIHSSNREKLAFAAKDQYNIAIKHDIQN